MSPTFDHRQRQRNMNPFFCWLEFSAVSVDKNYRNFTRTRPNTGIYQPDEPENHKKEREERKGTRARGKTITSSL